MKSKIGFHVDIQGHQGQVEKMISAETRIIKVISSMGMLHVLHEALGDKTIFIARDWKADDDFLRYAGSDTPKRVAERWLEDMRPSLLQAPYAYWESFNEMSNWDAIERYGEFEAERQRLLAREGLRACIGNFATGTPPIKQSADDTEREDAWPGFYPALEVAHELGNLLGLHEYSGLWMDLWYGPNQSAALRSGNRVPFPDNRLEGWLFARYRKVWRRHIKPNNWTNIRIALTEFGLDGAGTVDTIVLAGYLVGAWKSCGRAWQELDGRSDTEQYYVDQLKWCDRQMQKDKYVVGCTIFTWGTLSSFWRDWDIEGQVADKLIEYIAQTHDDPGDDGGDGDGDDGSVPTPPPMPGEKMYVTTTASDGLVVRSGPGTNYVRVASALIGDPLQVLGDHVEAHDKIGEPDQWIPVRTADGVDGWVLAQWVKLAYQVPPGVPGTVYIHTTREAGLAVRAAPGGQHRKVGRIYPEDRVEAVGSPDAVRAKLGVSGEWLPIVAEDGLTGWVNARHLEELPFYVESPVGHALVGLHGPADPGSWAWDNEAYAIVDQARLEAVKLLAAGDVGAEIVNKLKQRGVRFIMARLLANFTVPRTPEEFVGEVKDGAKRLYDAGIRYFEVHNEPNVHSQASPEGQGIAWENGEEFGEFFLEAVDILKRSFPEALFGWPGLSPGPQHVPTPSQPYLRYDSAAFEEEAALAIKEADFLCMHTYWGADGSSVLDSVAKVKAFCEKYPRQVIFVSEFSNTHPNIGKDVKGREYVQFYRETARLHPNLGGLFSYVLSSLNESYASETWRGSQIATLVGNR
jgi:hypothetical protein